MTANGKEAAGSQRYQRGSPGAKREERSHDYDPRPSEDDGNVRNARVSARDDGQEQRAGSPPLRLWRAFWMLALRTADWPA
jgi:hypothetical protein